MYLSRTDVDHYRGYSTPAIVRAERAEAKLEKKEKAEKRTGMQVLGAVEVGGTAFGWGFLQGYRGMPGWGSLSADLITGIVLHAASFMGYTKGWDDHVVNIANGSLAFWGANQGAILGERMKNQNAGAAGTGAAAKGEFGHLLGGGGVPFGADQYASLYGQG